MKSHSSSGINCGVANSVVYVTKYITKWKTKCRFVENKVCKQRREKRQPKGETIKANFIDSRTWI
jgi:hypothetical protein